MPEIVPSIEAGVVIGSAAPPPGRAVRELFAQPRERAATRRFRNFAWSPPPAAAPPSGGLALPPPPLLALPARPGSSSWRLPLPPPPHRGAPLPPSRCPISLPPPPGPPPPPPAAVDHRPRRRPPAALERRRQPRLVCNGEIYNFRELRRELEALGHRFPPARTARCCSTATPNGATKSSSG